MFPYVPRVFHICPFPYGFPTFYPSSPGDFPAAGLQLSAHRLPVGGTHQASKAGHGVVRALRLPAAENRPLDELGPLGPLVIDVT